MKNITKTPGWTVFVLTLSLGWAVSHFVLLIFNIIGVFDYFGIDWPYSVFVSYAIGCSVCAGMATNHVID